MSCNENYLVELIKVSSDLVALIGFDDRPGLGEALVVAVAALGWAILAIVSTLSQRGRLLWSREDRA